MEKVLKEYLYTIKEELKTVTEIIQDYNKYNIVTPCPKLKEFLLENHLKALKELKSTKKDIENYVDNKYRYDMRNAYIERQKTLKYIVDRLEKEV